MQSDHFILQSSRASEKCLNNSNSNLSNVYFEIHPPVLSPFLCTSLSFHFHLCSTEHTICIADLKWRTSRQKTCAVYLGQGIVTSTEPMYHANSATSVSTCKPLLCLSCFFFLFFLYDYTCATIWLVLKWDEFWISSDTSDILDPFDFLLFHWCFYRYFLTLFSDQSLKTLKDYLQMY